MQLYVTQNYLLKMSIWLRLTNCLQPEVRCRTYEILISCVTRSTQWIQTWTGALHLNILDPHHTKIVSFLVKILSPSICKCLSSGQSSQAFWVDASVHHGSGMFLKDNYLWKWFLLWKGKMCPSFNRIHLKERQIWQGSNMCLDFVFLLRSVRQNAFLLPGGTLKEGFQFMKKH